MLNIYGFMFVGVMKSYSYGKGLLKNIGLGCWF